MGSPRLMAGKASLDRTVELIETSIEDLDSVRQEVARAYYQAPKHSPMEFELGECLQMVRKAEERFKKARQELGQAPLPFQDDG